MGLSVARGLACLDLLADAPLDARRGGNRAEPHLDADADRFVDYVRDLGRRAVGLVEREWTGE